MDYVDIFPSELLHEVHLRASINRMDAHNLALVIAPNLVGSGNPMVDVAICVVGSTSTSAAPAPLSSNALSKESNEMTLGTLIKLCIERYYEIFDDITDRGDAVDVDPFSGTIETPNSEKPEDNLAQSTAHQYDSDDDDVLVMPVPSSSAQSSPLKAPPQRKLGASLPFRSPSTPPSSFATNQSTQPSNYAPYTSGSRRRPAASISSSHDTKSINTRLAALGTAGRSRAKALLASAADKVAARVPPPRSDTYNSPVIVDGNAPLSSSGTLRKGSGAGVSAHGVTASGFFAPP